MKPILGLASRLVGVLALAPVIFATRVAHAVPGPDSVAVVANANVPDSIALAQRYASARQIPARQVCAVDVPDQDAITLAEYRSRFADPLEACLRTAGVLARIESVVVVRGIPLRVTIPAGAGMQGASLAAVLGAWHSQMTADNTPFVGQAPGANVNCGGTPCLGAHWNNPFRTGVFSANFTATQQGVLWRPLLVTMLNARNYVDATRLVTSAIEAERPGAMRGELLFMDGADPARGVLDREYDGVIAQLVTRGITTASRVPFNAALTGRRLSAFFTGTAGLGSTIEMNSYLPGSIVDNLTSVGAEPVNFHATGEAQVSIARWVAAGASGVHGAVEEPLNNCFPSRSLMVDYVDGSTLAESYMRNMPFVYWRNLVLGDPMLAPYATRPRVVLENATDGETIAGMRHVVARATDPMNRGVASIALFVDGVEVGRAMGDNLEACLSIPPGDSRQILAVAQIMDDGSPTGRHQPKGWTEVHVHATPGGGSCDTAIDAGIADAGTRSDGGATSADVTGSREDSMPRGGCGCHTAGHRSHGDRHGAALLLAMISFAVLRRRSASP